LGVFMFDVIIEALNGIKERLTNIEAAMAAPKVPARYLDIESAGVYIDKTYEGMRHTIRCHEKELKPIVIGGTPRIDIRDIDRLAANLKGKK
jgi:hypothetical protein